MSRSVALAFAVLLAAPWLLQPARALAGDAPARTPPQCFLNRYYRGFRPVNDHEFIILVRLHDYYRITTAGACPKLTRPNARLLTTTRGSDAICDGRDWDLRVAESGDERYAEGCIVQSQTPLTPAQSAALPSGQRP